MIGRPEFISAADTPPGRNVALEQLAERLPRPLPVPGRLLAPRLPTPLTPIVGREREVSTVRDLLADPAVRLVTLTGPGGVGKTRLALRVAEVVGYDFPDGVWFVPLGTVQEPSLVLPVIAQALQVRETGQRPLTVGIAEALRGKDALLVLDNFEHVLEAAPGLVDVLTACDRLACLVTSRAALRVSGEHAFLVSPLALPSEETRATAEHAGLSPAVRLFVSRARAADPGFVITDANADDVVSLCRRLDGLPLALELAAAQTRHLTVAELTAQLADGGEGASLRMLTGGTRDAPARQQTLRRTIAWSHNLLEPSERRIFRRLAVFTGGFTLAAAAVVTGDDGGNAAEEIASLLDQSLLHRNEDSGETSRYDMLETVREFALEQLAASGEDGAVRDAQAAFYLALAEEADLALATAQQEAWLARLAAEHDNLRSALAWLHRSGDAGGRLRLAGALWRFWHRHGDWLEGRVYLKAGLEMPGAHEQAVLAARIKSLTGAGWLAYDLCDFLAAAAFLEEGLECHQRLGQDAGHADVLLCRALIARSLGENRQALALQDEALALLCDESDHYAVADALCQLGMVTRELGDYEQAAALFDEALAMQREAGHRSGEAVALLGLGDIARDLGNAPLVREHGEASLGLFRELDETWGEAFSLHNLAVAAYGEGHLDQARDQCEASIAIFRRLGGASCVAEALVSLAMIAHVLDDREAALASLAEALPLALSVGPRWLVAFGLEGMAHLASTQGEHHAAVGLASRAAMLRAEIEVPVRPNWAADRDQMLAMNHAALGERAFATAWDAGQARPLDAAVADAVAMRSAPEAPAAPNRLSQTVTSGFGLSARESEVLRLLVAGHSDREIATALFISPRTASKHVGAILAKLNVATRGDAVGFAVRHGLT